MTMNYLNIKTPAAAQAKALKSDYGLVNHGLSNLGTVYWNLSVPALYEEALFRREGQIAHMGPFVASTGKHTARSANDKFVVREDSSTDKVNWGEYNRPFSSAKFNALANRLQGYLEGRDLFVQDVYAGADPEHRIAVRVITELAWHSLFAKTMFIEPATNDELRKMAPDFTIICAPGFKAAPEIDMTQSNTFIVLNFASNLAVIGNTAYAGEIKKSVFTVLNYLLPLKGVLPMHCSANIGKDGDSALFFGLSGTGKTTLSADPTRGLIGDDEHGWSDQGIFNFENGCYAKIINLSAAAEPQIHATTRRFGTVLENVVYDPVLRVLDLDDCTITENTRGAYPLSYIDNAVPSKSGGHPKNVVMLTCDASGVLPPIARLSPDQALYHFISGYTAKVSGTETDMRQEPEATFSACFGAPFMVHHPSTYAALLKKKILHHGARCWLVNTGWTGGPYGVGKRISIRYTRAILNAALEGRLDKVEYGVDPVFGFQVPKTCEGVPDRVLDPASSWPDRDNYMSKYRQLASLFIENFKKFKSGCPPEVAAAGPKKD
ncbi:MAG: phosphoenolpyruvate carboxykinase (ATP) [Elusimicrobia bacterium GWA2_69_24]|nr:MAG: phosphoenolpyruvate carboxykinase (ATP) [Elusimicrobia bacterium GWA2_69_24]HBL16511.1 phosphoenolpyruvate carboxykinase (ATP) [Elusimicrobiota bacterium]